MSDIGGYIWFVALGGGLLLLTAALVFADIKRKRKPGNPNNAWEQAASETGHEEVARPEKAPSS